MKTVLSISGGGMRGIGPARVLAELEKRTGRATARMFDLIAGTSTGAILACLACCPTHSPAARWAAFYRERGPRIFPRRLWGSVQWAAAPKYSGRVLAEELRRAIGPGVLAEAAPRLMVATIDAGSVDAVFLKSWEAEGEEWQLWEAAAASASAQTYFPAFAKGERRYIDGGSHTNNPAASALFEAWRLWPGEEILLVSLGTGRQKSPEALPDGGLMRWAPLLFGVCSETQDDVVDYYCRRSGVEYVKLDWEVQKFPAMDDAREKTLDLLEEGAWQGVLAEWPKFAGLVERLKEGNE